MDPSALTILRPWVQNSKQKIHAFIQFISQCWCEKDKNKQKTRPALAHI